VKELLKLNKNEKERLHDEKYLKEQKENGEKIFEKQIEEGKITFDSKGNMLNIRQVNTQNLPIHFKDLINHQLVEKQDVEDKKLDVKKKSKKDEAKERELENEFNGKNNLII
jgi:hypothetical protein